MGFCSSFCLDGIETCFIELPRVKQKHVIFGCIYRHPHSDRVDFQENLQQTLESLNNQGYEAYITGDINVDLFQYNTDKQTLDYLDMLLNFGYMPTITKATRITDHSSYSHRPYLYQYQAFWPACAEK